MAEETKTETTATPKKKKIPGFVYFVIVILLIIGFFWAKGDFNGFNDYFHQTPAPSSANVELQKFTALSSNKSMSVELWFVNLGHNTSTNINVFVRARNQTGALLCQGNISLTSSVLRNNETTTGTYMLTFNKWTTDVFSTIELSYDGGRKAYQRETLIR